MTELGKELINAVEEAKEEVIEFIVEKREEVNDTIWIPRSE